MFVRTLDDLNTAGMIKAVGTGTRSGRYLTAADRMGFSYNDNRIAAGAAMTLWYKHHWEANFIISGRDTVTDLTTGQTWPLEAGVLLRGECRKVRQNSDGLVAARAQQLRQPRRARPDAPHVPCRILRLPIDLGRREGAKQGADRKPGERCGAVQVLEHERFARQLA